MKVFHAGKLIGEFSTELELFSYILHTGYFPNIWQISDHGNPHIFHLEGFDYGHPRYRCDCEAEFDPENDYIIED